jgi:hypothetical protein
MIILRKSSSRASNPALVPVSEIEDEFLGSTAAEMT